jgi:hypothetical protein
MRRGRLRKQHNDSRNSKERKRGSGSTMQM